MTHFQAECVQRKTSMVWWSDSDPYDPRHLWRNHQKVSFTFPRIRFILENILILDFWWWCCDWCLFQVDSFWSTKWSGSGGFDLFGILYRVCLTFSIGLSHYTIRHMWFLQNDFFTSKNFFFEILNRLSATKNPIIDPLFLFYINHKG